MSSRIKKGDNVIVITGADKGKTGKVLKVMSDDGKVLVEGINRVWKHVRPSQRYPQGGRIQKDAPIQLSNVQVVDPTTGKGTRIRFETRNGVKHRIAVKSGTDLGADGKVSTKAEKAEA
ncbi:50S ribosomal protein L24 [Humisphaera borealis]|uniref:Large ribosomal subunit protein uL24 n=1 Tax=Humisphaera borealis TaxID=2807512 RepID=A0A7M2WSQ4_9BACT|nr:50S ribosomal protein L24 [Humisphaera borealis]QOV88212.1 50S ribosomal protein L24 [Humisphaera borealis]